MEFQGRDRKKEYCVGLDITDIFSQVSIGSTDSEEVETLNSSMNSGTYMIPTALFKRSEVNQWFAGREAVRYKDTEGYFIDRLIEKARSEEEIKVGEESFRPSALLALFMKRTLSLVNTVTPLSGISCLMITVDVLDKQLISVLSEAVASLGLKTKEVRFQTHMESFYNYVLFQPKELWNRDVLLFDSTGDYLRFMRMECNKKTTPIVAMIDTVENTEFDRGTYDSEEASGKFADFVSASVEGHMYSSAYLVGDEFKSEWCHEGANILCRKGRVFQGNNLFSKGAVYAARNYLNPSVISTGYAFLGDDKLKSNVGINVFNRGEKGYLALLDGGVSWYDAKTETELILNQENKITFVITPLTGKNPELVDITLGDLPSRPAKTTRIHLSIKMLSETRMQVIIKDLGFGELFSAANVEWNEVISV